jgi:peptidoglycan/xylan/chitin deacetylase (PgdA/CDA1 family)
MTPAQIRELSKSPLITVAAHTLDHCDLKGMNEAGQRREIFGSKQELEAIIGKPVTHFAYPYGDFNDVTVRLVHEAGYTTATSTIQGSINNETTALTMRRLRIGNSLAAFVQLINK